MATFDKILADYFVIEHQDIFQAIYVLNPNITDAIILSGNEPVGSIYHHLDTETTDIDWFIESFNGTDWFIKNLDTKEHNLKVFKEIIS